MERQKFLPKARLMSRETAALHFAQGKRVLHIGMGGFVDNAAFTHRYVQTDLTQSLHGRLAQVAQSLSGLDINARTIEAMQAQVPGTYYVGDITDRDLCGRIPERFDVVLLLDVIEHLDCFRAAFDNLKTLLAPGGTVVISTSSAYCLDSICKMLFNYESTHEEHTAYFSYLTLKRLLAMNQFEIQDFLYTLQTQRRYGSMFEWLGFNTMALITKIMPQFAQGILVVAQPVAVATTPLQSETHYVISNG